MENHKMLLRLIILCFVFGLSACKKNESTDIKVNESSVEAHTTSLVGSLVIPTVNSPELFAKEVINDRPNFKYEIQTNGNESDLFITNDNGFSAVIFWVNSNQEWASKGVAISLPIPIQPDNLQVLRRLVLRLNDADTIEKAINNNINFQTLNNGAGITTKHIEDRVQYEIY